MKHFFITAINSDTGAKVPNPTFTVMYKGQSTPLATIYSDEILSVKANPFQGDAFGRGDFYPLDADYDIKASAVGVADLILVDVTIVDEKHVMQVVNNDDVYLLENAFFRRSGTPGFDRSDTTKLAMALALDRVTNRARFLYVGSGANPIAWSDLLRVGPLTGSAHYMELLSVASGSPEIQVAGAAGNIGLIFRPKGTTGQVEIGANALKVPSGAGVQWGSSAAIKDVLTATATWDPASLTTGAQTTTTITVTGAVLGNLALASFSLDVQGLRLRADVTAVDTVTVILRNDTGGTVDLGSGTLRAVVVKQ